MRADSSPWARGRRVTNDFLRGLLLFAKLGKGEAGVHLWFNPLTPRASRLCTLPKPGRLPLARKPARHGNPELRQLVRRAHELTKLGVGGP